MIFQSITAELGVSPDVILKTFVTPVKHVSNVFVEARSISIFKAFTSGSVSVADPRDNLMAAAGSEAYAGFVSLPPAGIADYTAASPQTCSAQRASRRLHRQAS